MKRKRKTIVFICIVIITVPLVGYIYTERYGYLYVSVWNTGESTQLETKPYIKIEFTDNSENLLAIGESNDQYGTIEIKKPDGSYCIPGQGSTQWRRCYRAQSLWLKGWVDQVSVVTIKVNDCAPQLLKAIIHEQRLNMLTWWVPHPHIGGSPYTYFNFRLAVNAEACVVEVA